MGSDFFNARQKLHTRHNELVYYRLQKLEEDGLTQLDRLPFSIRIMLEGLLRQCNGVEISPTGCSESGCLEAPG